MADLDLSFLPLVNACLNATATVLLVVGLILIKRKQRTAHQRVMISAFGVSCIFLVFYLLHYAWRASVKGGVHTKFNGEGFWLIFYYLMLISHILLAMAVPFFAIALLYLGFKKRFETHRRLARIGWPIWMYVSVTGVMIYLFLYPFNPPA